jgi:hypothetical protein
MQVGLIGIDMYSIEIHATHVQGRIMALSGPRPKMFCGASLNILLTVIAMSSLQ